MAKIKKIPMRQCVGCREKKEKKQLIRVVCNEEKIVEFDITGRKNGRGAYICPSYDCLSRSFKTGALNRAFETSINDETRERLILELEEINAAK